MPGRASEFTADHAGRTADVRSVPERADSEAVAGRLVPSYVLQRSAAGAAPRCAGGPARTRPVRPVPSGCRMRHAEVRYIGHCSFVDGRIVLTTSSCLDPSALRPFGCILRARPMHAHETVRRTP